MINKIDFLRKIKKNRVLVLIISAIVICGVYFAVQKAVDAYVFNSGGDIVWKNESTEASEVGTDATAKEGGKNWFEKLFGGGEEEFDDENGGEGNGNLENVEGQISEEEIDLEIEGQDEMSESGNAGDEAGSKAGTPSENIIEEKIFVYITGEVNVPGVVVLNKGSRIVDAINAAGGTTVKANISKVNLVFVLEDGMKVNIPNNNDLKNNPDFEYITMASGDGASEGGHANGGGESSGSGNSSGGSSTGYSVVNINTATQTELESLPGIGPSLALKIINYRKDNGKFSSIEDIKNVSGIGERKFEELKKYIRV